MKIEQLQKKICNEMFDEIVGFETAGGRIASKSFLEKDEIPIKEVFLELIQNYTDSLEETNGKNRIEKLCFLKYNLTPQKITAKLKNIRYKQTTKS